MVGLNTAYSVLIEVINYRLCSFINHYSKATCMGINTSENLDFQQLMRIIEGCIGFFHVEIECSGELFLNHLGCSVVRD